MNYHNITTEDMKNGDGLRSVLWVAGCSHHCKGCQNPVTWDGLGGIYFDEAARNELMESLDHDYVSGITFSGGDPLFTRNRYDVLKLIKEIKEKFPDKTVWMYTGYTYEQLKMFQDNLLNTIINNVDVLVDGPYIEGLRNVSLKWRGSSNQRVIDMNRTRETGAVVLHCD